MDEACDPVKQAEVAAIVMQPGLANVCLLTGSTREAGASSDYFRSRNCIRELSEAVRLQKVRRPRALDTLAPTSAHGIPLARR